MGRGVFEASEAARAVFRAADGVLDFSLSKLCFEGPEDELVRTENQQPAILTTSIALLRALEEALKDRTRRSPASLAGHSPGAYTALVPPGALRLPAAVRPARSATGRPRWAATAFRAAMRSARRCSTGFSSTARNWRSRTSLLGASYRAALPS